MKNIVNWTFPLPRTHTGMLFGNGTTGLMVWGEGQQLKITIGRADFWDHRGGMKWSEKQNFRDIRTCLEANDADGIKALFATDTEEVQGQPDRPSVVPVGRVDLNLGTGCSLESGELDVTTGIGTITYVKAGEAKTITIQLAMETQLFTVQVPGNDEVTVENVPVWQTLGEYLESISFEPPVDIDQNDCRGWIQDCPADQPLGVAWQWNQGTLWVMNKRTETVEELAESLSSELNKAVQNGLAAMSEMSVNWWKEYWQTIPEINVPNETAELIYSYGLYKFAGLTNPTGIAATLQGPWIEEYQMPPWSSDYHFNINVQMCYWPAYKSNKLEHLKPLFDLVWSWRDQLQNNARAFVGIEDGYMLPHAVDDQCTCMGSFWTGTIDHACTAWVAQMMFDYCRYSNDKAYLAEIAFPFMTGTMRVFEEMLEFRDGKYVLPVSVSPEYGGADMDAWGADASFQLAAIHRLCENLIAAAAQLNMESNPVWQDILVKLPKVTTIEEGGKDRIALWQGQNLEDSHRHHSHLAAICPFDSIDIESEQWETLVNDSIDFWTAKGMGYWSGWCVPWASMIHARLNNGSMSELLLETWERVFTNEGHGTLHDSAFPGFTLIGSTIHGCERPEIMQMDAGMGAIVAVQDMLVHSRRGIIYPFAAIPDRWKEVSFKNMLVEGGFLISGLMEKGSISNVAIQAQADAELKLANPWRGSKVKISSDQAGDIVSTSNVIILNAKAGETFELCVSE